MHEGQLSLDFDLTKQNDKGAQLRRSYSGLLWDVLNGVYDTLGFNAVDDPVFRQLVLARLIERHVLQVNRQGRADACPLRRATLYFEIQKEDEYRKPGLSKERRLEPQITV